MRKIGLIGGVGWRSTEFYYRFLNEEVAFRLGGLHSPQLAIESLDFAQVRAWVDAGREDKLRDLYLRAALALKSTGAKVLALCSNAAHTRIAYLQEVTQMPFVHISTPLVAQISRNGFRKVLLLGTRETMEHDFMKDSLRSGGTEVVVPKEDERDWLHRMIFEDLEQGAASALQKARLVAMIDKYAQKGVQAAILGCTELPLLLEPSHASIPCLDTTRLHALAILDAALET
jgi:aspartate racemase